MKPVDDLFSFVIVTDDIDGFCSYIGWEDEKDLLTCCRIFHILQRNWLRSGEHHEACDKYCPILMDPSKPLLGIEADLKWELLMVGMSDRTNITCNGFEEHLYDALHEWDTEFAARMVMHVHKITYEEAKSLLTIDSIPEDKDELRRFCRWLLYPDQFD